MVELLYGAGLRLMECLRLRVKDIDFGQNHIVVRDGKGQKDRVTLLPATLREPLRTQIDETSTSSRAATSAPSRNCSATATGGPP
jgi:site-specific recombinase XerD